MSEKIKKGVFVIFLSLIFLVFLEVSFRIMYSIKYKNSRYLTYGLYNVFKIDTAQFKGYYKLGAPLSEGDIICHGFRTAPFSIEKPVGEYRIIALGESSTYGLYDSYDRSWPYLLEQKLRLGLDDYKYKVINAGIPGLTTYAIDRLLTADIFRYKPDMIILCSLYNHIDIDVLALYNRNNADYFFRLIKTLFYEKSLFVTHIIDFIGLRLLKLTRNREDKYRYLLTDIVKKCKEKGVDIVVIKQLIRSEGFDRKYDSRCRRGENVYSTGKYYDFLKIIDDVCAKYKCTSIDFSDLSPACKGKLDRILVDNVHLTPYGNELLAETVAEEIIKIRNRSRNN